MPGPKAARWGIALLAVTVAACKGTPGTVVARHASPLPVASASTPAAPPVVLSVTPAPVASATSTAGPGQPTPAPAAALAGLVHVPAGVLSNNGASIISNNGSAVLSNNGASIISNNGGAYRLQAAATELPLVGAPVELVDAAGQPARDAAGKPLVAVTDAHGGYAFAGPLPTGTLLARVALPGAIGRLQAIALPGTHQADVGLVSTLSTTYILEQYVKGQPDPVKTLARLTAQAEADTLAKTATAVGQDAGPATLAPDVVVAAVEALRKHDSALDAQLEVVRKLLIAAGQSDLGNGRPALEVALGNIGTLVPAADGSLYINANDDRRVWRLTPDGKLYTAAGNGTPAAAIDGLKGPAAGLATLKDIAPDGQGGLFILEQAVGDEATAIGGKSSRLTRLDADGVLHKLWDGFAWGEAVIAAPDGRAWVFTGSPTGSLAAITAVAADGTHAVLHSYGTQEGLLLGMLRSLGRDASGRLWLNTSDGAPVDGNPGATAFTPAIYRLDPATFALTRVEGGDHAGIALDADGTVLVTDDPPNLLAEHRPDGTKATLLTSGVLDGLGAVAHTAGGTRYLATGGRVFTLIGGQLKAVAGADGTAGNENTASSLALQEPSGNVLAPDGTLYVADALGNRIVRIATDQKTALLAGTGAVGPDGDGGPAAAAKLAQPGTLRLDGAGNLYVADDSWLSGGNPLRKIALGSPGAPISTVFTTDLVYGDFVVAPDGTLYVSTWGESGLALQKVVAGEATTLYTDSHEDQLALAFDAAGTLYVAGAGQLRKWVEGSGLVLVKADPTFTLADDRSPFAIDPRGRFYMAHQDANTITRYDAVSGHSDVVAGPGGSNFAGTGVDDSLKQPGHLSFDAAGNLYVADPGHRQVKRIAAARL